MDEAADTAPSNLARNLRALRDAQSLTQAQLSERAGLPRATLAHLETGAGKARLADQAGLRRRGVGQREQPVIRGGAALFQQVTARRGELRVERHAAEMGSDHDDRQEVFGRAGGHVRSPRAP
jgi:transcriptional regulator with XRE-family HTH domain